MTRKDIRLQVYLQIFRCFDFDVKRGFPSVSLPSLEVNSRFFSFSWQQKPLGTTLCYRFESDEHADHLSKRTFFLGGQLASWPEIFGKRSWKKRGKKDESWW